MLINFVPTIFFILWYNLLLSVAIYDFTFSFSYFKFQGIVPGLTQGGGKEIGRPTLCEPIEAMWTQVGEMMNGGIMSGRRVIYVDKGAGPHIQSWDFPSSTTLEPNGQ